MRKIILLSLVFICLILSFIVTSFGFSFVVIASRGSDSSIYVVDNSSGLKRMNDDDSLSSPITGFFPIWIYFFFISFTLALLTPITFYFFGLDSTKSNKLTGEDLEKIVSYSAFLSLIAMCIALINVVLIGEDARTLVINELAFPVALGVKYNLYYSLETIIIVFFMIIWILVAIIVVLFHSMLAEYIQPFLE